MDAVEIREIFEEIINDRPSLAEKIAEAYRFGPDELEDVLDENF